MPLIEMLPHHSRKGLDRMRALSAGLVAGLDRFPAALWHGGASFWIQKR